MGKLFEDTAHVSIKKSFAGQVQDFLHNVFDNKYSSSRQQQKGKKETPNPKKTSFDLKTCGSRQHLLYILLGFGGSCSVFFPAPRSWPQDGLGWRLDSNSESLGMDGMDSRPQARLHCSCACIFCDSIRSRILHIGRKSKSKLQN